MKSLKKKLISGGVSVFLGKVVTASSSLLTSLLIVRLLPPDLVGLYFLIFTMVMFLTTLVQLGLNQAVVRVVSEYFAIGKRECAWQSIFVSLKIVFLCSLIMVFVLDTEVASLLIEKAFNSSLIVSVGGLSALWIVCKACGDLIAESFRGLQNIVLATLFGGVISSVLNVVLLTGLWIFFDEAQLKHIMLIAIISSFIPVFIGIILLLIKNKNKSNLNNNQTLKKLFEVALPLWGTNLALFSFSQAGLLILGGWQTPEDVAVYGACVRITALVSMPLIIINSVIPPIISEMSTQNKLSDLENILRISASIFALPQAIMVFVFFMYGESILGAVFGEAYRQGENILIFLSLGAFINALAGSCGLTLVMTGHQLTMLRITLFIGCLSILGALLMVEQYGAEGVALTIALSLALQNILMLIAVKNKCGIWTHIQFSLKNISYEKLKL